MVQEDVESVLREMMPPLSAARRGGAWLRLRAARPDAGSDPCPSQRPRRILRRSRRMPHHRLRMVPGHEFVEEIRSRLSVTDNLGRRYQVHSQGWGSTVTPGPPG